MLFSPGGLGGAGVSGFSGAHAAAAPVVGIVLGSDSDLPIMRRCHEMLDRFSVPYEQVLASAHRSPARTRAYAQEAAGRGLRVLIAGAGGAAHLAGALAAETTLPVIGVPLNRTALNGLDALLSTVQMPTGVPVATVAVDGAANAALLAMEILALNDPDLAARLLAYREELARGRGGEMGGPVARPGAGHGAADHGS